MSGSLNMVQIIGNLGRDPESRSFDNGGKVVNLRIATSETWKDQTSGERKEKTEWHSVAVFNERAADYAEKYLRKGSKVYVRGTLRTRKWQDQQGNDRYSTEVAVERFDGVLTDLTGRADGDEGGARRGADDDRGDRGQSRGGGGGGDRGGSGGNRGRDDDRGRGGGSGGGNRGGGGSGGRGGFADDLDDDVPF